MPKRKSARGKPLVVMMLPNASRPGGNPFVGLLVAQLRTNIVTSPFSWRGSLLGRYDILHTHWPEYLLESPSRGGRLLRAFLLSALMSKLKLQRRPWIVTFHNTDPHSGLGRVGKLVLRRFVRTAKVRVYLNDSDRRRSDFRLSDRVIPHGDYLPILSDQDELDSITPQENHVITFGSVRPYKGVERLIAAFSENGHATLHVCGRADDQSYAASLQRLARTNNRVDLRIGELTDDELAREIRRSHLVALPYKKLYNSGAAFLALSLGRPLLLPRSPTSEELLREFGDRRIQIYDGIITRAAVEAALESMKFNPPQWREGLGEGRTWESIGKQYSDLYEAVVGRVASAR